MAYQVVFFLLLLLVLLLHRYDSTSHCKNIDSQVRQWVNEWRPRDRMDSLHRESQQRGNHCRDRNRTVIKTNSNHNSATQTECLTFSSSQFEFGLDDVTEWLWDVGQPKQIQTRNSTGGSSFVVLNILICVFLSHTAVQYSPLQFNATCRTANSCLSYWGAGNTADDCTQELLHCFVCWDISVY